jgi:Tfp pilus assembly protein PilO
MTTTKPPMTTKKLGVAAVGGVLAIVLVWYVALWKPQRHEITKLHERRTAAVGETATVQQRVNELVAFQKDEPARRAELERLRQAVPDQPSLAEFVLAANDQAKQSGVSFLSITPSKPDAATAAAAGPKAIKLAINVNGAYFQVLDFLDRFNALPRVVVLDDVKVNSGGDGSNLAVTMTGQMFATSVPVPPGANGTTAAAPTTTVKP